MTVLSDHTAPARKPYRCDQCGMKICIGERYRRQVYVDGGLQTYRAHEDCDNAAAYIIILGGNDPRYDDPPNLSNDLCPEDYGWLLAEFPAVADRFGIQGPVQPFVQGRSE